MIGRATLPGLTQFSLLTIYIIFKFVLRKILEDLKKGKITIDSAERIIKALIVENVENFARIDLYRELRAGVPEVVYGESKSKEELLKIVDTVLKNKDACIVTRINKEKLTFLIKNLKYKHEYNEKAETAVFRKKDEKIRTGGRVGIITAGTGDIKVAEEAKIVAKEMGCEVFCYYDVGIAGLHRIFPVIKDVCEKDLDVLIVAAGMEGALPSVVASLVDIPVIALPTSIGYGVARGGETALKTMLSTCSPGIAVVNIDNGFGAGAIAALIANRVAKFRNKQSNL